MPDACRFALLAALAVSIMIGCAGPAASHAPSVPRGEPIPGDWDDVVAAANVAATSIDAAVESSAVVDDTTTITLRLPNGESGSLIVRRRNDERLDVSIALGLFGHEKEEQALLNALAHRLDQLRGVDYAPR